MKAENKSSSVSCGIGFTGLLTIVFIVLKLLHVIEWSWWWVLSPALFSIAVTVLFLVFYLVLCIIVAMSSKD